VLGLVDLVFGPIPVTEAAARAAALGFAHIDVTVEVAEDEALALPVVDRYSPSPRPGRSTGAPPEAEGNWDRAVRAFRRAPGSLVEPWPG